MQIQGENIKLKLDYSGNETKLKGVFNCTCGQKTIIDEVITDSPFDFINEKEIAKENNNKIINERNGKNV